MPRRHKEEEARFRACSVLLRFLPLSSAVIVRLIRHSLAAATEEGAQSVASVFVLLFKISAGAHHLLLFGWQKT